MSARADIKYDEGSLREDDDVDVTDEGDGTGYLYRIWTNIEHGIPDWL